MARYTYLTRTVRKSPQTEMYHRMESNLEKHMYWCRSGGEDKYPKASIFQQNKICIVYAERRV